MVVPPPLTEIDQMLIKKYDVRDVRVTLESLDQSSSDIVCLEDDLQDNIFENLFNLKPSTSYAIDGANSYCSIYKPNFEKTTSFGRILDVFMKDIILEPRIAFWSKDVPFVDESKLSIENDQSLELEDISQSTLSEIHDQPKSIEEEEKLEDVPLDIEQEKFDPKLAALPLDVSHLSSVENGMAKLELTSTGDADSEKPKEIPEVGNDVPVIKPALAENGHPKKIKLQLSGYRIPKKQRSEENLVVTNNVPQSVTNSPPDENKVAGPQNKENNSIFRSIMSSVQSGGRQVVKDGRGQQANGEKVVKDSHSEEPKKRTRSPSPGKAAKKMRNDAAKDIITLSKNILNRQSPAKRRKIRRSKEQSKNIQKSFILSRPLPDLAHEPKSILRSPTRAKSNKRVLFNVGRNETFHIKRLLDCHLYQDESTAEVVTQKQCSSLSIIDQFLLSILRWNPLWFNEYIAVLNSGHEANLPPIFNENLRLEKEMPTTFVNFDEYQETMLPFAILEVWDSACSCKTNVTVQSSAVDGLVCPAKDTTSIELFQDYYVRAIVPRTFNGFDYENLVEFSFTNLELGSYNCFLGFIRDFNYQPLRSINEVAANMREFAPQESINDYKLISFTIRAKAKANIPRNYHGHLRVQGIMPLSKHIRYIETLSYVCCKQINAVLNASSVITEENNERFDTNSIAQCIDFVYNEESTNSILLYNFDTKVNRSNGIADIVEALQQEKLSKYTVDGKLTKKCAILVLCSNNLLLDYTSRRILSKIQKHKMADPEKRFINFVRIGSEISEDLRPYSLEALVERNLKVSGIADEDEANNPDSQVKAADLQAEIGHTKANLLMLQNNHEDIASPQSGSKLPNAEILQIETKLRELEAKLKKCKDKRVSKTAVHRQRCTIIFHADVVAMSLDDCANPMENSILSDENKPVKFTCAIFDEAQCNSELETLLPMKYGVEKLILFGSSKTNDKTMHSLKPNLAKHCNFGSLFQRLRAKNPPQETNEIVN